MRRQAHTMPPDEAISVNRWPSPWPLRTAGARLDQFLAQSLGWSRARLQKLAKIRAGLGQRRASPGLLPGAAGTTR